MTNEVRAPWATRGGAALALAALLGGALVVPATGAASAAEVEIPTTPVISTGTTWKYLDTNIDPSAGDADRNSWAAPGFDDGAWKQAASAFGVKNNALGAVGPYTPVTKLDHYINGTSQPAIPTYFFRTTFTLDTGVADQLEAAVGNIVYDDAVRIYVNGEKVANFRDGRVDDTLESNLQYAGENGGNPVESSFTVPADLLHDGANTVAVALYQDRAASSDAYFDVDSLTFTPKADDEEEPGGDPTVVVAAPTRVILTPTKNPATSQSFSWTAGDVSHEIGKVEIVPVAGGASRLVDATAVGKVNGNQNQHFSATIGGLTKATAYKYRVGLPGSWSEWFEFTTADPKKTDFQFVYYGDAQIGLDTTWPGVVAQAEAKAPR